MSTRDCARRGKCECICFPCALGRHCKLHQKNCHRDCTWGR